MQISTAVGKSTNDTLIHRHPASILSLSSSARLGHKPFGIRANAPKAKHIDSNFYMNEIKQEIKIRFLTNQKWKHCGLQLSLPCAEDEQSLLEKIFELKGRFLLHDIYSLIFMEGYNYLSVYTALREVLSECELISFYSKWSKDPLSMLAHCIEEHSRRYDDQAISEQFMKTNQTEVYEIK